MRLLKKLLTKNECYIVGRTITPKGVMVHSTGANNPKLSRYVPGDDVIGKNAYNNHWNQFRPGGRQVCVHAFIGQLADGSVATVQTLPWNHRAWHCASGPKGSGINTHIAFEICEDGLKDATYFNKVYKEAVELTAYLCKMYNLDPKKDGVVICHSEGYKRGIASNHGDVMHWFPKHGKSMDTFRADVAAEMKKDTAKEEKPSSGSTSGKENISLAKVEPAKSYNKLYSKVYTTTASLNMRRGPNVGKSVVQVLPKGTKVRCYGYYTKTDATIWLYVKAPDGDVGYCSKKYLI